MKTFPGKNHAESLAAAAQDEEFTAEERAAMQVIADRLSDPDGCQPSRVFGTCRRYWQGRVHILICAAARGHNVGVIGA